MADSVKEVTPEETEDLDDTKTSPPSPHGSMGKETIMADHTDDEIFLSNAIAQAKLAEEEKNKMDTESFPTDQDKTPPRPARERSPLRHTLPPISPRGVPPAFQFPQDIRLGAGGVTKPKSYEQRPMGKEYYRMPTAPRGNNRNFSRYSL